MNQLDTTVRRYQPTGVLELGLGGVLVTGGAMLAAGVFGSTVLALVALVALFAGLALAARSIATQLRQHPPPRVIVLRTNSRYWYFRVAVLVFFVLSFALRNLLRGHVVWVMTVLWLVFGLALVGLGYRMMQRRYAAVGLITITLGAALPFAPWSVALQVAVALLVVGLALLAAGLAAWRAYWARRAPLAAL